MEQYNDAVDRLKDPELRKMFEREAEEYGKHNFRDVSYEDRDAENKALQKHYRAIQKEHSRA